MGDDKCVLVIREFDPSKDLTSVEEVEKRCEVGPSGKLSLFTDLLGDPICRVRHSPAFLMLVAELSFTKEIVGMIRGCIKTVTCGKKLYRNGKSNHPTKPFPVYTKLAYILGLRVSPSHRRMGIGLKLVRGMEDWFVLNGAEYSYLATENDNKPSVKLFTDKCGYSKFRTPSILVNPVFAHQLPVSNRVTLIKLPPSDAELLYRRRFSTTEFFPRDIDSVLNNRLNIGTFLAVPRGGCYTQKSWPGPFGLHFLYGLGGEGPRAAKFVNALCAHAHNLAKQGGCSVVATEVANLEPLKIGVPHWKSLSCDQDLWCIKRLGEDYSDGSVGDWTKSPPGLSIFVDPREF
ncbi:hypothetical protein Gotri_018933 [Gossypium trilobum]|uniref:N-acetyltransferase domain-containing protein n=1 Tax=Gossypium trilobum TaxID=34281 RepID=A0A7J9ECL6_9ROSI|nr:hypothetical protein [Gossypium trilobum]